MKRVVVFGTTGSGKTRLAEQLRERLSLRVIELDALYWGRGWQPAPLDLFRYRVENEIRDGDWIVVGIYGQVRDLTWRAADTLIWLDLPLPLVMWRLFWRTIRRAWSREELWGTGNRERFAIECAFLGKDKTIVRLRSTREVEAFLASHSAPAG